MGWIAMRFAYGYCKGAKRNDRLLGDTKQWPFQEPKLEVPTIYKAYARPM
jgi:hypothetical protein